MYNSKIDIIRNRKNSYEKNFRICYYLNPLAIVTVLCPILLNDLHTGLERNIATMCECVCMRGGPLGFGYTYFAAVVAARARVQRPVNRRG